MGVSQVLFDVDFDLFRGLRFYVFRLIFRERRNCFRKMFLFHIGLHIGSDGLSIAESLV